MTANHETIAIGDWVRLLPCGVDVQITAIVDRHRGLYQVGSGVVFVRHQFTPLKWENDVIGVTGIGVCAAGGAGQ